MGTGWWFRSQLDSWSPRLWPWILLGLSTVFTGYLILQVSRWLATRYSLTPTHVTARFGVLSRTIVEVPLHKVQSTIILRRPVERLLGLGSIRIESAGSSGVAVWWHGLGTANVAAKAIRQAATAASSAKGWGRESAAPASPPIVIGLTGSIGAGKTAFAKALGDLGAVMIDSDAQARAALDTPSVRESLVAWWGNEILDANGAIDRSKVGKIVFATPAERARLERLIHPLVRQSREGMIRLAATAGARFVVADVPLLFEAGVDAECDVTVYIDAPRELRLRRVAARGWDAGELARREASQWPIEQKRARADERIENAGALGALNQAARALLTRVGQRPRRLIKPAK